MSTPGTPLTARERVDALLFAIDAVHDSRAEYRELADIRTDENGNDYSNNPHEDIAYAMHEFEETLARLADKLARAVRDYLEQVDG